MEHDTFCAVGSITGFGSVLDPLQHASRGGSRVYGCLQVSIDVGSQAHLQHLPFAVVRSWPIGILEVSARLCTLPFGETLASETGISYGQKKSLVAFILADNH